MQHTRKPLETHCEWRAVELSDETAWTERLSPLECEELDVALQVALKKSDDLMQIREEDFPMPTLHERLMAIEETLIEGRGFVRIRGIDRNRYSQMEMETLYWGIGMHLGTPWPQNKHGHILGDVTDQGKSGRDPTSRGNEIGGSALPFHCDGSDLVGLLCLENGLSGGLSAVANSVLIHNQLIRETPDLAAELYQPQPFDFRGEQKPGSRGWYQVPVFTEHQNRLYVRCIPPYIWASQRHTDAPRLTDAAIAALKRVETLAADPANHITMALEPGDMQFINNYHVMHGRTAYEDDKAAGKVRHLKRLWLETPILLNKPSYFARNVDSHWNTRPSLSRL